MANVSVHLSEKSRRTRRVSYESVPNAFASAAAPQTTKRITATRFHPATIPQHTPNSHTYHGRRYVQPRPQQLHAANTPATASNQRELPSPPTDAISSLTFSPYTPTRLLVSSWDKYVHLYDTHSGAEQAGSELTRFAHAAPVLDCCFGEGDGDVFSAALDWSVNR